MIETVSASNSESSSGHFISPKAADIYRLFNLSSSVPPNLIENSLSSLDFLEGLIMAKCHVDAIEFLAHGLPNYLGLEWAYMCINNHGEFDLKQGALLKRIREWLDEPDETIRRIIGAKGEEMGFDNPLGWLALAVFLSGGSITPEEAPETLPPQNVRAHMTSGTIILLVAQDDPKNIAQNFITFLDIGMTAALKGTLKQGE